MNESKEKENTKKDWSLILSVIAIIISIISLGNDIYRHYIDNKEMIYTFTTGIYFDETITYDSVGGIHGQGMISSCNYAIIISNNSKQTVSIVSDEIFQKMENSKIKYSRIVEKVINNEGEEVTFPITLNAGESILLTYKINVLIPSSINMLLLEKYGTEAEIVYKEMQAYLGNNGKDVFGNDIKYTEYADGNYIIEADTLNYPVYYLLFETARGNFIETILAH